MDGRTDILSPASRVLMSRSAGSRPWPCASLRARSTRSSTSGGRSLRRVPQERPDFKEPCYRYEKANTKTLMLQLQLSRSWELPSRLSHVLSVLFIMFFQKTRAQMPWHVALQCQVMLQIKLKNEEGKRCKPRPRTVFRVQRSSFRALLMKWTIPFAPAQDLLRFWGIRVSFSSFEAYRAALPSRPAPAPQRAGKTGDPYRNF